ncbi:MAG: nucleoside diphosphate kinase regulator [Alphaproteobacteria bacterium]
MNEVQIASPQSLPRVVLSPIEQARLIDLAQAASAKDADVAAMLMNEADRAELVPACLIPDSVVVMRSYVEFRDDTDGTVRQVQLVYPKDADIAQDRISILTPIGAALIGLQEGQIIPWPTRDGRERTITVLRVDRVPLRAPKKKAV